MKGFIISLVIAIGLAGAIVVVTPMADNEPEHGWRCLWGYACPHKKEPIKPPKTPDPPVDPIQIGGTTDPKGFGPY